MYGPSPKKKSRVHTPAAPSVVLMTLKKNSLIL
jgi:hypothetical protein